MRRPRLDFFEMLVLVALAGWSVVVLAMLLTKNRPLSGADGFLAADQLQYFTWIREASHHVLIGNRYDLAPGERVFFHPLFAVAGALHAAGVSVPLSYLVFKPLAVAVMFIGALAYVRRLLAGTWERRAALVLVLFAVMPAAWIVAWTGMGGKPRQYTFDFISGEMWSGQYLWGYLPTALAVFGLPLVLLALERRRVGAAAAGALLVGWLQPWQGATLGLIVVVVAVWRRERPSVAVLGALALPAIYYLALSHFDAAWELAGEANRRGALEEWSWPWWAIGLTLAPLAIPAALAYRRPARGGWTWQEQAVRVWPIAALVVFALPVATFPYHAFQGLAIPLSILAVTGVAPLLARLPRPRARALAAAGLAFFTLPGLAHKLEVAVNSIRTAGDPYWVFPDEVRALKFLERDARPGGVLAAPYAGSLVPSRTGRETWVGALSWSPDFEARALAANAMVERGAGALALARRSRARFVFVDCRPGLADLEPALRPELEEVRRFGCASVYVLRARPGIVAAAGRPDR